MHVVLPRLDPHRKSPQPAQVHDDFGRCVGELAAAALRVAQGERPVAVAVIAQHLDVGNALLVGVLLGKELAHAPVAVVVVDRSRP